MLLAGQNSLEGWVLSILQFTSLFLQLVQLLLALLDLLLKVLQLLFLVLADVPVLRSALTSQEVVAVGVRGLGPEIVRRVLTDRCEQRTAQGAGVS